MRYSASRRGLAHPAAFTLSAARDTAWAVVICPGTLRTSFRLVGEGGGSLGEEPVLLGVDQGLDHRVEVTSEDRVQAVQGEVDPVVGHAGLRVVVRAYLRAPVAAPDHAPPCLCTLRVLLLPHQGKEPRGQDLHRLGLVLVLALLVLAGDHQPGGDVGYADGRVGRVDALAAGA